MTNESSDRRPLSKSLRPHHAAADRAHELRLDQSPPERVLWSRLRRRQLGGFRFRRQHALGPFIADFYCAEAALVIEIDSAYHEGDRKQRDAQRDAWFAQRGVEVLRITASELATNERFALEHILHRARERCAQFESENEED